MEKKEFSVEIFAAASANSKFGERKKRCDDKRKKNLRINAKKIQLYFIKKVTE